MAEPILIKLSLDGSEISQATGKIRSAVKSALDSALPDAKEAGRKIGNALADGMAEGLKKAAALKTQLNQVLGSGQKSIEAQERAHQQRLAEIRERGAQQQAAIAARAAAQAERDARRFAEAQAKAFQRAQPPDSILGFFKRYSSTIREAGESIQQAGYGLLGLTAGVLNVGKAAVTSAVNIDRQVNVLKALTGSAQAAEERFAALVNLSAKTPGLTTSLAATLDAQLRVANVSTGTIDKLLPAIGRLNAVAPLGDPQKFGQNLVQLITQGFERADLKELVGQSPLAGELIKSIFKVDSPINGKAIKEAAVKLGITTTDAFFAAFADAAAKNPKLAGITESLGTQFEKLRDRVIVALRPLGLAIIEALKPLVDAAVPIIERLSKAFADLSPTAKQAILLFAGLAAAAGPVVIALGGLLQAFGAIGNIVTVVAGALGIGGSAGIAGALSALLPIIAAVVAAVAALFVAWETNFGGIREITADVVKEAIGTFQELRDFWAEIAPDLKEIGKVALDALSAVFSGWSSVVGAVWSNAWDFIKTTMREALDVIKPAVESILALLTGDFDRFKTESAKLWSEAWDFIITLPARAFSSLVKTVEDGLTSLLTTTGFAKSVGLEIGDSLGKGIVDGFIATASSTSTSIAIRAFLETVRGNNSQRDALRQTQRNAKTGAGLDGEEITIADLAANKAAVAAAGSSKRTSLGSGSGAESKARQLREALLQQQKSFIEQSNRLQEDANKRELEQFKQLYDDKKVTISEFYDAKLGLTQASIGNEINALQQEITAQEKALAAAKAGTPEKIRLETELNKLRTDLILKTRALTDAERENQTEALKALNVQRTELLKLTQGLALKLDESGLPSNAIAATPTKEELQARQALIDGQRAARDFQIQDLELQRQELQIQNAVNAGVLSEAQGKEATLAIQRQYRDVLIQSLELQKAGLDPKQIARINVQIEQLRNLGQELSPTQAFFKGFRSEAETLAESFERIGKSFKDSVLGVVDSGIDKLTKKLGFFKSLVGDILKSLARVLLGGLLQPRGGGAQFGGAGGGGGFLGNILGSVFGGGGGGGFATGGFAGGGGAASILGGGSGGGGLLGALTSAVGGGTSAPPSLSSPLGNLGGIASLFRGGSPGGVPVFTQDILTGGGQLGGGGLGGVLGNLFSGIGFGKAPGSGGALAGALPLLGLSLGSSLGTDRLTSILGGAAGGLLGIGLSAAPGIIGAGGALSGLGFLAPLFSNPITAIAAGLALPAIFLLGRARQRKRDEKSSGDFLQDAINQIRDVKKQVESNELTLNVTEARKLFDSQILQPFIAQINTLKSKSVRESRLKNQTVDLRNLFEKEVIPAVQAQKARQGVSDKLIPEFAIGGIVPGFPTPGIDSVLARVSPGEMVLTVNHQRTIAAMAGGDVFAKAGVPSAGVVNGDGSQSFARGGFVSPISRADVTPTINMTVQLVVSGDEAVEILNAAASTDDGQQILVNARRKASRNRVN